MSITPSFIFLTQFVLFCMHWQSRGDFIVVGDLMRSVSLLVYKAVDGAIEVGDAHCRHGRFRRRILAGLEERVNATRVYEYQCDCVRAMCIDLNAYVIALLYRKLPETTTRTG